MSKRDDIIIATKSIIANEGVSAATIANILKTAKTGYGTLYNYFENKEELYMEVYKEMINRLSNYILMDYDCNQSSKDQFRFMLMRYIEFCLENTEDFYTLEVFRVMPEMCMMNSEPQDKEVGMCLEEFINMCIKDGHIKKRDGHFNQYILLGIVASFIKYYHESDQEVTEDIKEGVIDICFNALK